MAAPRAIIGRLTFEFGTFGYDTDTVRKRPTKVSGLLSHYRNTPPAQMPLGNFTGGDTANVTDPMEGFDKGHVIQVSHSNVSDPENIVPMYPCFNQAGGIWRELEQRIAQYTDLTHVVSKPRNIHMTVEIEYGGTDPRFPTAFLVTVKDRGYIADERGGAELPLYFKGVALDRLRITHLPTAPAKIDPLAELGADVVGLIAQAKATVESTGWTIERLYANLEPPLVASLAEVPKRPYAMLDFLWLQIGSVWIGNFLTDGCRYRHRFGSQFHERQKMLIRLVNAIYNDGSLKSDYPGDTGDALIIGSGKRAAQIDHVFPFSQHGGNLFSNALVASGDYNNRMSAKAPGEKWADRSGATFYSDQRHM